MKTMTNAAMSVALGALVLGVAQDATASPKAPLLARELRTEIDINASADVVWRMLTDFPAYPEWNPFITTISGQPLVGERLTVTIRPPGLPPTTLKPVVQSSLPKQELSWLGRLYVSGLFDGRHIFELHHTSQGTVRFVQREQFGGLLVPVSGPILRRTEEGFRRMNEALKERAEAI